jgi:anti-anti-sigma factor
MKYTVETEQNTYIVKPAGRLDSATSPTFESDMDQYLREPKMNLLIDCDELDYVSSAGLRVILNAARSYKNISFEFAACNMQDHVREVFEISGFDSFIAIYNSPAEFLQKVS